MNKNTENYSVEITDSDYWQELRVIRNTKIVRIETDRGEPEDQSFCRNWSWVKDALMEAYYFGLEDGKKVSDDKIK